MPSHPGARSVTMSGASWGAGPVTNHIDDYAICARLARACSAMKVPAGSVALLWLAGGASTQVVILHAALTEALVYAVAVAHVVVRVGCERGQSLIWRDAAVARAIRLCRAPSVCVVEADVSLRQGLLAPSLLREEHMVNMGPHVPA